MASPSENGGRAGLPAGGVRALFLRLHRWFGLFTAVFLFVSGATGAVISWDHELDGALNPEFYTAASGAAAPRFSSLALADEHEANDPRAHVTFLTLVPEPGEATSLFVTPRVDPLTQQPYELDYNQVSFDPGSGEEQARRYWGRVSLAREDLLPFLYKLHYSLHIPDVGGVQVGVVFMGLVAIVWVIDCFVSLWISFPSLRTWWRSFRIRTRSGSARLLFDVHRSGGVWVWGLLLVLATTAVSMNLGDQVVRPLVGAVSTLAPDPFALREERPPGDPVAPKLSRAEIVDLARAEGLRRGMTSPPGSVFYAPQHGLYGVAFHPPGDHHGDFGLGNAWIYFDGADGAVVGDLLPGTGSLGDLFLQAQFPLHSGRILGLPGRVVVSLMGGAVAALSATGVWIWARRLRWRAAGAVSQGGTRVVS